MLSENKASLARKSPRKITPQRLKNIALFYLKRFETTEAGLRVVLKRRIDTYARYDKEFNPISAYSWIEDILNDFIKLKYIDDARFAEIKIRNYLSVGKSPRYIVGKLREKGISESLAAHLLAEQEFDPLESAIKLAKKKKIGPWCPDADLRLERRPKDLAILIRAGFDYDIAVKVLNMEDF